MKTTTCVNLATTAPPTAVSPTLKTDADVAAAAGVKTTKRGWIKRSLASTSRKNKILLDNKEPKMTQKVLYH